MKNQKHSVVIGQAGAARPNWNAKLNQILSPRRKRAWSSPAKMNPLAAVNCGWWLKKI